ncbi:MAG: heme peroxidase [Actinomycetota bacterium]|nr:heme peroxidase [Actinomycetota bacterium]
MAGSKRRWAMLLLAAAGLLRRRSKRSDAPSSSIDPNYRNSLPWKIYNTTAQWLDHKIGWDKFPTLFGLLILVGIRNILRQKNLHDASLEPAVNMPTPGPPRANYLTARSPDGSYNDLDDPGMGMAATRFGRNIPIEHTSPESEPSLLDPNPRTVSRELLTRREFIPANTVNSLAAAWLQFMVRDWFAHGKGDKENAIEIPLSSDDGWPEPPLIVPRTPRDPTRPPEPKGGPPTYINTQTHWWDASQIYGSSLKEQGERRTGKLGKLNIGEDGLLVLPDDPKRNPANEPGWWMGLHMMLSLFTLEHNATCDHLHSIYPLWTDDELFERARLINAALIAKIHTVEWTPAIISHPTTIVALKANWWGLAMERINRLFGRVIDDEVLFGIPGSKTQHFTAPYAMTEEFVSVYRMHPLIADDWSFRSVVDDGLIEEKNFREISGPYAQDVMKRIGLTDLYYSFGTSPPGAIVLHNYPKFLQEFERPDGHFTDLAAVDIVRIREVGVPRYNEFRRLLHLKPAASFEDLTDVPEWAEEMRRVYKDDIERVDLMVGMFAEKRPEGFAFSDTAFRIFALMASRRLNSDRFFTTYYRPEIYSDAGMDWINSNTMMTVLLRHYPQLRPAMHSIKNAFHPWGNG